MSLTGPMVQSDSGYPVYSLWALEHVQNWLEGSTKHGDTTLNFERLLSNMENQTQFETARWSNEPEPPIAGGRLEYREPIWKLIHEVAAKYAPDPKLTQQECVTWLRKLIVESARDMEIKQAVDLLQGALGSEARKAVTVTVDEDLSGSKGRALFTVVVNELISKVTKRIEDDARARAAP